MFQFGSAVRFGSVRFLAGRTDGCVLGEWFGDCVRLPRYHAQGEGLVEQFPLLVQARVIDGDTNVGGCPRGSGVSVPYAAHFFGFVVLFAFGANCESIVGELDGEFLIEARYCELEDVSWCLCLWKGKLLFDLCMKLYFYVERREL